MVDVANMPPVAAPPIAAGTTIGKFDRPAPPHDWRFWVGGLGKVLIGVGLLMFGFVGYQLWGTGIETARAQNALESEFSDLVDTTVAPTTSDVSDSSLPPVVTDTPTTPPTSAVPIADQNIPAFDEGDAIARIEIPAIGVDNIVVAGVEKSDLKKGPGHYPETPLPGQLGNAAIAGHRTTYGQPFYDVDQLQPGDEIITTTPAGRFVYKVTGQQIVEPTDYRVVATTDPTTATLTLTSCHPRWTARQRIVITSELDTTRSDQVGEALINYGRDPKTPVESNSGDESNTTDTVRPGEDVEAPAGAPAPGIETSVDAGIADAFAQSWFSDPTANLQVGLWGLLLALIGVGSYLLSKHVKRDWIGALVGIVPFVIVLYFFFQNVNRLLPPNL